MRCRLFHYAQRHAYSAPPLHERWAAVAAVEVEHPAERYRLERDPRSRRAEGERRFGGGWLGPNRGTHSGKVQRGGYRGVDCGIGLVL